MQELLQKFGPTPALIELDELRSWILEENDDLLVINKPGWVVCHPSKNGPRSSLIGACRELLASERLHLVSRLDRETSGLVIIAKHKAAARKWQMALEQRNVAKIYTAILSGQLAEEIKVDEYLAKDLESTVAAKVTVRRSHSAKRAVSVFKPLEVRANHTLAEVNPITGRKHQIRAHALWLGHPVVGDKIYGPDDKLFLEFIEHGWTPHLETMLGMQRQALHCSQFILNENERFQAPTPSDMQDFWERCAR